MRGYYAARAEEYDQVYAKPERQADIRILRAWLPGQFAGARVLDVAAGTGFWTESFAPVTREVVLVDASLETLSIARRRLSPRNARFVVGDAYELPVASGAFDAAFVGFWFSHIPKAQRATFLEGVVGSVQPGGRLVLMDNRYVDGSNHPISGTDEGGNTYQIRRLDDGTTHRVLKNFPSEEELLNAARRHGSDAQYWGLEYYWVLTFKPERSRASETLSSDTAPVTSR